MRLLALIKSFDLLFLRDRWFVDGLRTRNDVELVVKFVEAFAIKLFSIVDDEDMRYIESGDDVSPYKCCTMAGGKGSRMSIPR